MTDDTRTRPARKFPLRTSLIAAALLGVGVAGGAAAVHLGGPAIEMAPANPVAIRSLADDGGVVTVRGKVAEVYGPMFVLADAGGRALVAGGRQVDGSGLIAAGQTVTVQGRYRNGLLQASFLVGADGKVTALHPMGPPHGGPGGRDGERAGGPHGNGPDDPEGRFPPPPPPADARGAAPAARPPAAGNGIG